jgi:citrate lyase subunit beta / citryl-CoA lyase
MRPIALCRSWLFLPGADAAQHRAGVDCGADVLVQELEDFTPPELREKARALAAELYPAWRAAGRVPAVRINPLATCGMEDLAAVMRAAPDIVGMSKVSDPAEVQALDTAVTALEREYRLPMGSTLLWPNVELARGVVQTFAIARSSPRVAACLVATEDLAADLGAERGPDALELAYCRQRFLVECVAAGVRPVDCPYTYGDSEGAERDARWARRLGYKAKSLVSPQHAAVINRAFTPTRDDVASAREIVQAFEHARSEGRERALVNGALIEVPTYQNALRLIARARDLGVDDSEGAKRAMPGPQMDA